MLIMVAAILRGYLQWFFRVPAVSFLGVPWGHRCGWGVFIKLQATLFPAISSQCFCVGVFLGILIIQERQYFIAFFSGYFLLLFIIIFIFLSISVYSLLQVWGFYNCHIHILLQCPVLFYLIWLICYLLNLPCVILLSFTLKIFFPQDFSLLFEINYRNCKKYFM